LTGFPQVQRPFSMNSKKTSPPSPKVYPWGTRDLSAMGALALLTALIWCYAYNRWSAESWRVPLEYGINGADADALGVLAIIRNAANGHFWPLMFKNIPELGAPFGANWNDIPFVEQLIYFFAGLAAKVLGVFAAANLAVLVAYVLSAIAFYLVCRALNCEWHWAFAGALIFAFARYPFERQLHHLQVLFYFCIPPCLLVTWWLSSKVGLRFGERKYWIAISIAAVAGSLHPYYTNMFIQLAGIACLVQFLRGNRTTAYAGLSIIAVSMAVFFALCANVFIYKFLHGANPAGITRAFMWLEFSALKPLDMIMPSPDHRLPMFAGFAQNYFKNVFVPGEVPPGSYLGLVGIAALCWLGFVSLRRMLAQPPILPPLEAWQVLWITLYSVVGGFNCFAGALGILLFRSSNRYSIFILAIVLIYAIRHISTLRLRPAGVYAVLPIAIVIVALWDQVPPPPTPQQISALNEVIQSDRFMVMEMEKKLPKGSMVFMLPLIEFPESPVAGVSSSDHFRPFLHSENLRFSFGGIKGRPEADWQKRLAQMEFRSVVEALENYGFAAVYLNRNGFTDKGEGIVKALAEMNRNHIIESPSGDRLCILLQPSSYPVKPL